MKIKSFLSKSFSLWKVNNWGTLQCNGALQHSTFFVTKSISTHFWQELYLPHLYISHNPFWYGRTSTFEKSTLWWRVIYKGTYPCNPNSRGNLISLSQYFFNFIVHLAKSIIKGTLWLGIFVVYNLGLPWGSSQGSNSQPSDSQPDAMTTRPQRPKSIWFCLYILHTPLKTLDTLQTIRTDPTSLFATPGRHCE